jgi:hypothetical protein
MSQDPNWPFDQTILDMIEHSPVGAVPHTPTYQDALRRLYAARQVYPDADHKDGHVTARSLGTKPVFHAENLSALIAGQIEPEGLEDNAKIFTRYVLSLPPALQAKAEAHRLTVAGRPAQHRAKHGAITHDPLHTLFLLPGGGPNPGLPGNYLYGFVVQGAAGSDSNPWHLHLHDAADGTAAVDTPTLPSALEKLQEIISSAPFHLSELVDLGFRFS